jgi:TRAP-type C4-dicarboxylate transport system substrate-binding protein
MALAAAGLMAAGFSGVASAQESFDWRLATWAPRGHSHAPAYETFAETVERMSDGQLSVDIVYEGEGVPATELLGASRTGLIEMAHPYMALHSGELPAGLVELGLPGGVNSMLDQMTLIHRGEWKQTLRDAYAEHGVYWVGESYWPPTYLLTKEPIESLDDLEGMKIRAPGAYGRFFEELGASAVSMPFGEIYTSLATGVIDGVNGMNLIDLRDGKFYEVAQYLYPLPITHSQKVPLIANMDAWNRLPEHLQEIVEVANLRLGQQTAMIGRDLEQQALQEMREAGVEMSPAPTEADRERWSEAGARVRHSYEEEGPYTRELLELEDSYKAQLGQ